MASAGLLVPATLAERLGIEQATDQVDAPMAIKQQSLGGSVDFSSWAAAKIPVTRGARHQQMASFGP